MRTRGIHAACSSLILVVLLAIAIMLMGRFQLAGAVRPVNDIRSIVSTGAINHTHNRETAIMASSTPPSKPNTNSSAPGWAAFIVSVIAALGVGSIASALVTAKMSRTDQRRQVREKRSEKLGEQSSALRTAVLKLTTIRAASGPSDADALTEPVQAVIVAHATFRQSARDAEIELGTTNQLSSPADEVMRAVEALMVLVPTNAEGEELERLSGEVGTALTRFNTSVSQLVQERGGSK